VKCPVCRIDGDPSTSRQANSNHQLGPYLALQQLLHFFQHIPGARKRQRMRTDERILTRVPFPPFSSSSAYLPALADVCIKRHLSFPAKRWFCPNKQACSFHMDMHQRSRLKSSQFTRDRWKKSDEERVFQASKHQIPSFSAYSHHCMHIRSALQLIYHKPHTEAAGFNSFFYASSKRHKTGAYSYGCSRLRIGAPLNEHIQSRGGSTRQYILPR
jgi:hypothetical protein